MAENLTLDFDALTPRMLADFKRATGLSLLGLVEKGELSLDRLPEEALAGMIWLAMRMGGKPDATFDDALDTPFTALELAGGDEDELDPTPAG